MIAEKYGSILVHVGADGIELTDFDIFLDNIFHLPFCIRPIKFLVDRSIMSM